MLTANKLHVRTTEKRFTITSRTLNVPFLFLPLFCSLSLLFLQPMATLPSKPNSSVNFFIKYSLFNPIYSICRVWVYYSINALKVFESYSLYLQMSHKFLETGSMCCNSSNLSMSPEPWTSPTGQRYKEYNTLHCRCLKKNGGNLFMKNV